MTTTTHASHTAPLTTEHSVTVDAPPALLYDLVADVTAWPRVFGPTVHVEVDREPDHAAGGEQMLRIWAVAHERVRTWRSRRVLDPQARTIGFRQVASAPPVAAMGGEWRIEEREDGTSRVVLLHDYRALDDDRESLDLIGRAVDANSRAELTALKDAAETGTDHADLTFTFSDSLTVLGAAGDVYTFLDRADRWPELLPHVARADLTEEEPGHQHLDMDTRSPDGSTHHTTSVRVCFPDRHTIVYKQLVVPVAMRGHSGRWVVETAPDGTVTATSSHTVTLDPEGVRTTLGDGATLADARAAVQVALSANSATTLEHAKRHAEKAARSRGGRDGG